MSAAHLTPRTIGIIDRILATVAWACQLGAAALYLAVTFQADAWQKKLDQDPVYTVNIWVFAVGMAFVWLYALYEEQAGIYNRRVRSIKRKTRIFGHFGTLFIAASSVADQKDRVALWIIMGMAVLMATGTWASWMQTRTLPAEDQAVIDAIHDREAEQVFAARDLIDRERRRERLNAIATGLGYRITDKQAPAPQRDDNNNVSWTVPPGKHAPLVYFIANGNRLKIGTSTELKRRIRTLALRAENVALLLDGDRRLERKLHDQFADLRIGNTEWFAYEAPLTDYVQDQIAHISRKDQQK